MTDPYRITDTTTGHQGPPPGRAKPGRARSALLWTLTAILAGTNTAMSIAGQELVGAFFGGAAVICLAVIGVRYLRRRGA